MKERLQSDRNFQWPNRAKAQVGPASKVDPAIRTDSDGPSANSTMPKITMLCFGFLFSQTEPERGESPRERGWKGHLEGGARRRAKINEPY
jgi:hypothetical protein